MIGTALGNRVKEMTSLIAYGLAIPLAFVHPSFSLSLYVIVALIWLVPDSRVEQALRG